MFTKKVPAISAKIVMVFGVILYLISLLILEPHYRETAIAVAEASGITDAKELSIIKAEAYPHYLHVMGILFVVNMTFMLVMGKLKPQKVLYKPEITDAVDITPWRYATIAAILISLLVLSTYFIF